jgi:hypothetical protein
LAFVHRWRSRERRWLKERWQIVQSRDELSFFWSALPQLAGSARIAASNNF